MFCYFSIIWLLLKKIGSIIEQFSKTRYFKNICSRFWKSFFKNTSSLDEDVVMYSRSQFVLGI